MNRVYHRIRLLSYGLLSLCLCAAVGSASEHLQRLESRAGSPPQPRPQPRPTPQPVPPPRPEPRPEPRPTPRPVPPPRPSPRPRPEPRPVPRPRPTPRPRPRPIPVPVPVPVPPRPTPPRHSLWLDGLLRPQSYESMPFYFEYLVLVEQYRYAGYPEVTMTFYPMLRCNDNIDAKPCDEVRTPAPSMLEVRSIYGDYCGARVFEAYGSPRFNDDISSAILYDNIRSSCAGRLPLGAEIRHFNGFGEFLEGYLRF